MKKFLIENLLPVGFALMVVGFIVFVSSGSLGEEMLNEAIKALVFDDHPFSLVARTGFLMMMAGTLTTGAWIFVPRK
ncbi:hypothetical protein AGJ34_20800 [Cronobacter dublinensis subsp. dublinensis]|nr:hypothetical protein [Cronobacter dublinensis subsp. dublinensis]EGT5729715.1 hypothetical protein [Cronobacter dublinensis subsp. dublinensis]